MSFGTGITARVSVRRFVRDGAEGGRSRAAAGTGRWNGRAVTSETPGQKWTRRFTAAIVRADTDIVKAFA